MKTKIKLDNNLVLFVGAGASIATPCCLPSFYNLRDFLTNTLLKRFSDIGNNLSYNIETKPELLLQIIWEYLGSSINPINGFKNAIPNDNHHAIASLCKKGVRLIITTNFDQCIERSLDEQNIKYKVYLKSPSNNNDVLELKKLIEEEDNVIVWKPHGDCEHIDTLCFTIEQVARLSVSKYINDVYEYILAKYNILTLGYSGYDDDLYPILLNYPKNNSKTNNIYWNSYKKIESDTPPFHLENVWGNNFTPIIGDMKDFLSELSNISDNFTQTKKDSSPIDWKNLTQNELDKVPPDWAVTILSQYFHRLNMYEPAQQLWKTGLILSNLSEVNRIRFELNLLPFDDYSGLLKIYNQAIQIQEFSIAKIALTRVIDYCIFEKDFRNAKRHLKAFKCLYEAQPEFIKYSDYVKNVNRYLTTRYHRNNKRIYNYEQDLIIKSFEVAKKQGDIISAISSLNSYIASLAESNYQDPMRFGQVLDYVSILEAYNIPTDLAGLYFSISTYASRLHDNELGIHYLNKCLAVTQTCFQNQVYDKDKYHELIAYIFHQKSMFGTANEAIKLIKEAINQINQIEDFKLLNNSREYFLGVYNSSLSKNFLILEKYNKALKYARLALDFNIKAQDIRGEARMLMDYGEILYYKGDKKGSIEALEESLKKHIQIGENDEKIKSVIKKLNFEEMIKTST